MGELMWWRHTMQYARGKKTVEKHGLTLPKHIGEGWAGGFKNIFAGGTNTIYLLEDGGGLRWYKHNGSLTGTRDWQGDAPVNVGTGWNSFKNIVAMGQGVFYATTS